MKLNTDTRGVSEVVGAILVFGLLIALLAIFQTQAVPAANEEVEFNHNQEVQSDLVKFHESTSRVASQGTAESTKIQMGTTYPTRLVFFNPRNPSGQIRTAGEQPASIENIRATDETTRKYIDGSLTGLETKRLEYEPNYNEMDTSPTSVLEFGTVYRDFGDEVIVDNPGQFISGNEISMTFFGGNLSRDSGSALSLEARATSAPARTVTVEPTEDVMTIRIPTNLNASQWEDILADEITDGNVEAVRDDGEMVEIDLDGETTYDLRMAQIGVGSGIQNPGGEYLVEASDRQLQTDRGNQIPLELRDKYNNPVSGESVNLSVSSGEFQNGQSTIETNTVSNGAPAARFFAGQPGLVEVQASFVRQPGDPGFDPENNKEDIEFLVAVDPQLDDTDPEIVELNVEEERYTTCTDFELSDIPILGEVISIVECVDDRPASQVETSYNISDQNSGLDSIEITVYNEDGDIILTDNHAVRGIQSEGVFRSAQFFRDTAGEPDKVEVVVYDQAGNSVIEELDQGEF